MGLLGFFREPFLAFLVDFLPFLGGAEAPFLLVDSSLLVFMAMAIID
jgi:hypothetical protein